MSKRYTVDETWELCLKMWKWISRQCKGKSEAWCKKNIDKLKGKWLESNGFDLRSIENHCFFCEYDTHNNDSCQSCPPRFVDSTFHCMDSDGYYFSSFPRKFYAKLKELNKIRLEGKDNV